MSATRSATRAAAKTAPQVRRENPLGYGRVDRQRQPERDPERQCAALVARP